jgi:hypothetical protein
MAKNITKVPNGPLIKKKGPFKGSTLKTGGKIKKAQDGFNKIKSGTKQTTPKYNVPESRFVITNDTAKVKPTRWINNPMPPSKDKKEFPMPSEVLMDSVSKASVRNIDTSKLMKKKAQNGDSISPYMKKRAAQQLIKEKNIRTRDSILNRNASARGMTREEVQAQQEKDKKKPDACVEGLRGVGKDNEGCSGSAGASARRVKREARRKNGGPVKKAQNGVKATKDSTAYFKNKEKSLRQLAKSEKGISNVSKFNKSWFENKAGEAVTSQLRQSQKGKPGYDANGFPKKKAKSGAMIKRADGSMSRRGLWDNIRANKGSGKKPTKQMLVQERKIKAKSKK